MRKRKAKPNPAGYVYLIHIDPGLAHARHYLGWAANLTDRVRQHVAGTGSPLLRAATLAGCQWWVACVWPADRKLEAALKRRHDAKGLCPVCSPAPVRHTASCFCPDPPLGFFPAHPPCDYHVSYAYDV